MISALDTAGNCLNTKKNPRKFVSKPGWNDYVKEAHSEAREAFQSWQCNAKPRFGPICELIRRTMAHFKYCLRYCKSIESRARTDALAKKFLAKDPITFGRKLKESIMMVQVL